MKRKALALILIIVIAVSVATVYVYDRISELQDQNMELQEQLRELENSIEDVRIIDFEWTSDWGPGAGGLQWGRAFNITLQNLGNSIVEGLSVDVKLLVNDIELWSETGLYGPGIIGYTAEYPHGFDGKLNASETREMRGAFISRLDILDEAHVWDQGEVKAYSVRVLMDDTIMDKLNLPYSW